MKKRIIGIIIALTIPLLLLAGCGTQPIGTEESGSRFVVIKVLSDDTYGQGVKSKKN